MVRTHLKTLRFTSAEKRRISSYLKANPCFDGFAALARLAILDFIARRKVLPLAPAAASPAHPPPSDAPPPFLWDYGLTGAQVREKLRKGGREGDWLMARILERGSLSETLRYLSPGQMREALPRLRLDPKRKRHWEYALSRWGAGA